MDLCIFRTLDYKRNLTMEHQTELRRAVKLDLTCSDVFNDVVELPSLGRSQKTAPKDAPGRRSMEVRLCCAFRKQPGRASRL